MKIFSDVSEVISINVPESSLLSITPDNIKSMGLMFNEINLLRKLSEV